MHYYSICCIWFHSSHNRCVIKKCFLSPFQAVDMTPFAQDDCNHEQAKIYNREISSNKRDSHVFCALSRKQRNAAASGSQEGAMERAGGTALWGFRGLDISPFALLLGSLGWRDRQGIYPQACCN